jgi:hypothetical protein
MNGSAADTEKNYLISGVGCTHMLVVSERRTRVPSSLEKIFNVRRLQMFRYLPLP